MTECTPKTHPNGEWVPVCRIAQETNVAGRAWRDLLGNEGVQGTFANPQAVITHWWFPLSTDTGADQ